MCGLKLTIRGALCAGAGACAAHAAAHAATHVAVHAAIRPKIIPRLIPTFPRLILTIVWTIMALESNRGITLVPTSQPSYSRHHSRIDGKVSCRFLRTEGRPWSRRIPRSQRQHADPRLRAARRASGTQIAGDKIIRQRGGARGVQRRRRRTGPGKFAYGPAPPCLTHSAGPAPLSTPPVGFPTHP